MKNNTLQKIREKMGESGLDSLIIAGTSNIRYLTGFHGDYGYVVLSPSRALFFTNSLYIEDARASVSDGYELVEVKEEIFDSFSSFDSTVWGKSTGYESEKTTCATFAKLEKKLPGTRLVSTINIVEELRESKHEHEIEAIEKAQRISEQVLEYVLGLVREGVEECELAMEIDYQFRKHGGERSAFETIVASGPHTSRPHAVPTRRKIAHGDLVLFDMGTVCMGYASDMTRTVVFGRSSAEQKKVYGVVLDAQNAALEGVQSGMKCSDLDTIARTVIENTGYREHFVHSLGHGVGLEVHENPFISKRSKSFLHRNAVVTIEPGIYMHGWGGIRIEDMVVVLDGGCKNLTGASKNLLEL